jgi:hypothetical protein
MLELIQIVKSSDVLLKMFSKHKLKTLKMKPQKNGTKHIHKFKSFLE